MKSVDILMMALIAVLVCGCGLLMLPNCGCERFVVGVQRDPPPPRPRRPQPGDNKRPAEDEAPSEDRKKTQRERRALTSR